MKLTETALNLYHALNTTEPFTYADHRLRKGLEYTAAYNLGDEVLLQLDTSPNPEPLCQPKVPFSPNGACPNCTDCPHVYDDDWCFTSISNRSGHDQMWEMAAAIYGKSAPDLQRVVNSETCQRYNPTLHYCAAYCDPGKPQSQCRPPAPPPGWHDPHYSVCMNATEHPGNGKEAYRPERANEAGAGLGTLLFYGMPTPAGAQFRLF